MLKSLLPLLIGVSLATSDGNVASSDSSTVPSTLTTFLPTNPTTVPGLISTEVPKFIPNPEDDNFCSLPCGPDSQGCGQCSPDVFTCVGKQLTAGCRSRISPETITDIDLARNNIKDFRSLNQTFTKLLILKLASNKITLVKKENMMTFPALKNLDLSHNELVSVEGNIFEGLPNLQELSLTGCSLYTLPSNIFQQNKQLRVLNIGGNKMATFPRDIFKPVFNRLTSLTINDNPIKALTGEDFQDLTKLQYLYMESLEITTLDPHTFSSLSLLREIDMDHNSKLVVIHENAFGLESQVPGEMAASLEKAYLRGCGLASLNRNTFRLRNMLDIGLSGNPWQCDCAIKWMVEKETFKSFLGKHELQDELSRSLCTDMLHRGIAIYALPEEHFICDPRMKDMGQRFTSGMGGATTVLVITFLMCLISIVFAVFIFQRRAKGRTSPYGHAHKQPTPTSVSQYRALYNQGSVQTHAEGFASKEKDPFEI